MYRNMKSKIVHITAHGGADIFSCGVKISSDYELIQSSQFLDLRKCKRCAISKPIRTVGQMASGLKKWRLAHEKEKGSAVGVGNHVHGHVPDQYMCFEGKCLNESNHETYFA